MSLSRFHAGKYVLSLCLTIFLAACYPTSQYPITGDPMKNLGETFSGIWVGNLNDGPATLLFMQQSQDDTGTFHIGGLLVGQHKDRPSLNEGWLEFEGEVVVIRDEVFLSARLNQIDGQPTKPAEHDYYLFRLILADNSMEIIGMNDLVTAELVNRGTLEGTVDHSLSVPSVKLTSSGADLRGFLNNADLQAVFSSPFATFTRRN